MSDEEKKQKIRKLFEAFDDIEPCKHCGRVMLAGWCCKKMLEDSKRALDSKKKR